MDPNTNDSGSSEPNDQLSPAATPPSDVTPSDQPTVSPAAAPEPAVVSSDSSAPAAAPSQPPSGSSAKAGSSKKFLMALVAVLVIAGGSAAAYLGVILPNKPDNVLKKSFINTLQQKQASSSGTFSVSSSGMAYKGAFSTADNISAKAVSGKLDLTVSGITFSVESRLVNGNVYVKVGDLSTIAGLASAYSPSIGSLAQSLSGELSNKWIVIDSTLLDGSASTKCALNASWTFTNADIKLIEDQYNKHPFTTIKSNSSDTVGGLAAEKFVVSIDNATLDSFGNGLDNLSIAKTLNKCSPGATKSATSSSSHGQTPLTIWVDKGSKRIVQIAYTNSSTDKKNAVSGSVTITLHYGPVSITAPANAVPAMQVLTQIESSAKSNPALLQMLSGSTGGATTGSTSPLH